MKLVVVALVLVSTTFAWQSFASGEGPFAHLSKEEFAAKYLMTVNDFDGATPITFDKSEFEAELGEDSHFDLREEYPGCVSPIRDQDGCGGCWAFAITSLLSDRECILGLTNTTRFFSPQHLIDCEGEEFDAAGCQGADTQHALYFADVRYGEGLRLDTCYPYESGATGKANTCSNSCTNQTQANRVFGSTETILYDDYDNEAMANEIIANGTVYMSMQVFEDFMDYKGGIYQHNSTLEPLGGHAIRIIG